MVTINTQHPAHKEHIDVAVAFLASDVNRFSINALTGAFSRFRSARTAGFSSPAFSILVSGRNRAFSGSRTCGHSRRGM